MRINFYNEKLYHPMSKANKIKYYYNYVKNQYFLLNNKAY